MDLWWESHIKTFTQVTKQYVPRSFSVSLKTLVRIWGRSGTGQEVGSKMIEDMGCEHRYQGCTGCCHTESDPPSSRVSWEDEIPRKVRADENEDTQSSPWPTTGLAIRKILGDRQSFSSL